MAWWSANNDEDFATIKERLGLRLEILDPNDELRRELLSAPVVYEDRNVRCVRLRPQSSAHKTGA